MKVTKKEHSIPIRQWQKKNKTKILTKDETVKDKIQRVVAVA